MPSSVSSRASFPLSSSSSPVSSADELPLVPSPSKPNSKPKPKKRRPKSVSAVTTSSTSGASASISSMSIDQKCTSCRKPFDSEKYKTCDRCREKDRTKRREKKKTAMLMLLMAAENPPLTSEASSEGGNTTEDLSSDEEVENKNLKRKRKREVDKGKVLDTLDDWTHAKKRMRLAFGTIFAQREANGVLETPKIFPTFDNATQFQTFSDVATEIISQLQSRTRPFYKLSASYTFSIITNPDVNHSQRVHAVCQELNKSITLEQSATPHSTTPEGKYTTEYICGCAQHTARTKSKMPSLDASASSTSVSATLAADLEAPALKRAPTNLKHWFKSKKASIEAQADANASASTVISKPTPCGGKIRVSAENDDSHPIGIDGQKITVEIVHGAR